MKNILFVLGAVYMIGCTPQKKTIMTGNSVYVYSAGPAGAGGYPSQDYTRYVVIKPKQVKIVDNGTYLIVQDNPVIDPIHYRASNTGTISPPALTPWKQSSGGASYFTESSDAGASKFLWYRDSKFVLQTASIPLKIRSMIRNPAYLDSFPSQVETGFNVGFLTGYKFGWNKYKGTANVFGQTTDKYSITIGGLLSMGGVDLSATTTRPKIVFPRKSAMVSYGFATVFGFNSINIGYAIGWDQAIGPKASTWLYKGNLWNGLILSLDLIK